MGLWNEAHAQFVANLRTKGLDNTTIQLFVSEQASPQDAKRLCQSIQSESDAKYRKLEIAGKGVPAKWIARIMDGIDRFIIIGSATLANSPETIGVAWYAVSLILGAIRNNWKLYTFFGQCLTTTTDMLVLINSYDTLYDQRGFETFESTPTVQKLFNDIKSIYIAILDLGMSVKRHIDSGKLARVGHALKDVMGYSLSEFEGKMGVIEKLKNNVLESSQSLFQQKTLGNIESIRSQVSSVQQDVQRTIDGQTEIKDILEDIRQIAKRQVSIQELTEQEYERTRKSLNALPNSARWLEDYTSLEHRGAGTCDWIFNDPGYSSWQKSNSSSLIWIRGEPGSGKSVVLATIADRLQDEFRNDLDQMLVYLSCDTGNDGSLPSLSQIQNTIIAQVYEYATYGQDDSTVLQRCNAIFKNPKQRKEQVNVGRGKQNPASVDFVDKIEGLLGILNRRLHLIIDSTHILDEDSQAKFVDGIVELLESSQLQARIVLSSREEGSTFKSLVRAKLDAHHVVKMHAVNQEDIRKVLNEALEQLPGWTSQEKEEAISATLEKTGSIFKYLTKIAIPFLRQPFVRPISNHLQHLPDNFNDTYQRAINQLTPNYLALLETAMVWMLCAQGKVSVSVIMDDYMQTYRNSTVEEGENTNEIGPVLPGEDPISELHVEQLLTAGSAFLNVDNGIVTLKDPTAVERFFLRESGKLDNTDEPLCSRCKTDPSADRRINITLKSAHLRCALASVRHINNRRFQKRYMQVRRQEGDVGLEEPEEPPVKDDEALKDITEVYSQPSMDPTDDKKNSTSTQNQISSQNSSMLPTNKEEEDKVISAMQEDGVEEVKSPSDKMINGAEELHAENTSVNSAPAESDPDESQDSEDRGMLGFSQPSNSGDVSQSEESGTNLRYEISYVFAHARWAEKLLTEDEKAMSPDKDKLIGASKGFNEDWRALQDELYQFIVGDSALLQARMLAVNPKIFEESSDPWLPIHITALRGLTTLATRVIKEGADLMVPVDGTYSPLDLALETSDQLDTIELLLKNGADPNHMIGDSMSPFVACFYRDPGKECIDLLLRYGASCSDQSHSTKQTALHRFALFGSDPDILKLLLDNPYDEAKRADINAIDDRGETPLHFLLSRFAVPVDLLKAFLSRGANPDIDDSQSIQPLYFGAIYDQLDAVKVMVDYVKDIDDESDSGRTALHGAAWEARAEIVAALLNHGAGVQQVDKHNRTPFFFACLGPPYRTVNQEPTALLLLNKMIESGGDASSINTITKRKRTPLREACAHGLLEIVRTLLGMMKGSEQDINLQDTRKGRSALHCAALHGHADIIKILISHGSNPKLKDTNGKTALDLCRDRWTAAGADKFEKALLLLVDSDTEAAAKDVELLSSAAMNGSIALLEKLLDIKADLNQPDQYGWTPLLLAKQYQRHDAVKLLSTRLAEIGMKPTKWNNTHATISVSDDSLQLFYGGGERKAIVTDHPIPAGLTHYYFEVEIPTEQDTIPNPIVAVGFCNATARHLRFPGWVQEIARSVHSWAYHSDDGGFYRYDSYKADSFGEKFGPGDVVGAGVDFTQSVIFHTLNGERVAHEFTDVRGRLFPVVGFDTDIVTIKANFGSRDEFPFRWQKDKPAKEDASD